MKSLYNPAEAYYAETVFFFGTNKEDELGGRKAVPFRGPRAASDATSCFEEVKSDPSVREAWLTRKDGLEWVFVAKEGRTGPTRGWENLLTKTDPQ